MDKSWLLLFVAVSFFFIAGCPGKGSEPIPGQEKPTITEVGSWNAEVEGGNATGANATGANAAPTQEENWSAKALQEQNSNYCLRLPANEIEGCVLPLSNNSLGDCLKLSIYDNRRTCLFSLAYTQQNMSLCDLLNSSDRDQCVEHLSPPCTFDINPIDKGRCLAFAYLNYTYCMDDQCLQDYAFEHRDSGACQAISASGMKDGCRSALENRDYCKDIEGSATRDSCYYSYALGDDNPSYCYMMQNVGGQYQTQMAIDCFTHFAISKNQTSLCDVIFVDKRWACYINFSLTTGDKQGCYAIDTRAPSSRQTCFNEYAYQYNDLTACNEVTTEELRQICYSAIVFTAKDLTMEECNGVILQEWKDKCFQQLAKLDKAQTYCNYIYSAAVKQNCQNQFPSQ